MTMSAGTIRLDFPRASVSPGFWARPSVPARPDVRQSVEVVESTSSAVARPASRLARWLPLVLRPLLGAFLLAASLFVVQASGVVPGFAPQTALACSEMASGFTSSDLWLGTGYSNNTDPNTQASSNTRSVWWDANVVGAWCYAYHFASASGGAVWYRSTATSGWGRVMRDNITLGSDGYPNSMIGNAIRYRSCSAQANLNASDQVTAWNGTCSVTPASGTFNNNLVVDTQPPTPGFHISDVAGGAGTQTCFAPGQMYSVVDGGSTDPSPSSGWASSVGMWFYYGDAWTGATGWVNNSHWEYNAPTPALGSQSTSFGVEYIRDNSLLQTGDLRYFNVDNTYPYGAWISGLPAYTNQTTFNLSMNAGPSGCQPLDKVVLSNDNSTWQWYGFIQSASNWNITNSGGGNTNQGSHTVYAMFSQRGVYNWTAVHMSTFYDTQAPSTSATSPTYSSSRTVPLSFTDSDPAPSSGTNSGGWVNAYWSTGSGWNGCNTIYNPPAWTGTINCTVPGDGLYSFATKVQDNAGNQSTLPGNAMTQTFVDTQNPTVGGHISAVDGGSASVATCFSPGQTLYPTDGGSSDPSPTSGWPYGGGMWFFYNNSTGGSGWQSANHYGYTAPTPASGTQGSYSAQIYIRDNTGNYENRGTNQSAQLSMPYSVDNTTPSNPSLTVPTYDTGLINLSFGATAGGCKGVDQVRISNDGTNWWNSSGYLTSYTGWDLANATYGGSTAQGTRTVYVAFHEAGTSNWTQTSKTLIYDTVSPSSPVTTGTGTGVYQSGSTYFIRTAVAGTMNLSSTATDATSGMQGIYYGGGAAPTGWTYVYEWGVGANPYTNAISWIANPAGTWGTMPAVQSVDKAGNNGPTPALTITPDNTAPTITFTSPVASMQATTSITAAWTESDAGAGVNAGSRSVQRQKAGVASPGVCSATWANDGAATSTASSRTDSGLADAYCYRYQVTLADLVGNSATATSGVVLIDTTAPSITASLAGTAGSNGWYVSSVTVTVTASDAQSGVSVQYSIDGGAWTAYLSPFVVNGDLSSHRVDYQATNGAGTTVSGSNSPIKIDTTNPTSLLNLTGTAGLNGWWRSVVTATPTGTDATSGIWTVYYRVDGGAWTSTTTSPVVVISVDGTHTVDWYALDLAGNQQTTQTQTIKIDTVHPTGTLIFDDTSGVTHSRFINASVTMADAGSGPLQVRFSTDGGFSWTAWTAYVVGTPTVTPLTLASGTGTYTVLAQIQDLAGNMTPLGHSTALLNAVIEPTLGAAAKIYDCATNTLLATNTTGTIYWPVDRTLCLVPTARLVTPGSDGTNNPTLVGTIAAPSGTPGNYVLHDPDQTWALVGGTWPTSFVGVTRTAADTPLRFTFGRETSSLSTSTPYVTIPYDTQAVVGWYNGATLVRSETVTVTLNLRVVAKNSGTTGTQ